MSAIDRIVNSRLAEAIAKLESGEPVDWNRYSQLQPLDAVREGQLQLAEALRREEEADEQLAKLGE